MNNIVTATEARNNFFNLAEKVKRTGQTITIVKNNEPLVELAPIKTDPKKEWAETKKILDRAWGMWKDKTEEELVGNFRRADAAYSKRLRKRALGK